MKVIFPAILAFSLSGCSFIMDFNFAEWFLDDVLGCDGVRTEWPCKVEYVRDDRMDLLSHDHENQGRESNESSRETDNGNSDNGNSDNGNSDNGNSDNGHGKGHGEGHGKGHGTGHGEGHDKGDY